MKENITVICLSCFVHDDDYYVDDDNSSNGNHRASQPAKQPNSQQVQLTLPNGQLSPLRQRNTRDSATTAKNCRFSDSLWAPPRKVSRGLVALGNGHKKRKQSKEAAQIGALAWRLRLKAQSKLLPVVGCE